MGGASGRRAAAAPSGAGLGAARGRGSSLGVRGRHRCSLLAGEVSSARLRQGLGEGGREVHDDFRVREPYR